MRGEEMPGGRGLLLRRRPSRVESVSTRGRPVQEAGGPGPPEGSPADDGGGADQQEDRAGFGHGEGPEEVDRSRAVIRDQEVAVEVGEYGQRIDEPVGQHAGRAGVGSTATRSA